MAEFSPTKIQVEMEVRQCYAQGKKGMFHRWVEHRAFYQNNAENPVISDVYGLVEMENGEMKTFLPTDIRFLDGNFEGYIWK